MYTVRVAAYETRKFVTRIYSDIMVVSNYIPFSHYLCCITSMLQNFREKEFRVSNSSSNVLRCVSCIGTKCSQITVRTKLRPPLFVRIKVLATQNITTQVQSTELTVPCVVICGVKSISDWQSTSQQRCSCYSAHA